MSFNPIDSNEIKVGKAVKKELWNKVKGNFDDHESRIQALSFGAAPIVVFNNDVLNASSANSLTGLAYYRAIVPFTITTVKLQIFKKDNVVSGILSMDIKKGTTLEGISFSSILTSEASIDFSVANDYDEADGTLDALNQSIAVNEYLRLDITSLPITPVGKFRVLVYGII